MLPEHVLAKRNSAMMGVRFPWDAFESPALSRPGTLKISREVPSRCGLLVLLKQWMIELQPKTLIVGRSPWIGGTPFSGKYDGARWSSAWWYLPPKRIWKKQAMGNAPHPSATKLVVVVLLYEMGIPSKDKTLLAPARLVFRGAVVISNGVVSNSFWRSFGCSTFPVLQTVWQCSWTWEACTGMFPEMIWVPFHFASALHSVRTVLETVVFAGIIW